jgi:uncharacterized protein YjbI with pentapeptide repeats
VNEEFRHRDMGEAVFDDVNLRKATFHNVDLSDATIRNANLRDLSIDEANITGMTVFGFDVQALIEAELDRRDPERLRFTVRDPYDPDSVREVMDRVDAQRADLKGRLLETAPSLLRTRPAPEKWSAPFSKKARPTLALCRRRCIRWAGWTAQPTILSGMGRHTSLRSATITGLPATLPLRGIWGG